MICAVHGFCVGAGVDMSASADIRLCSKDAWFQIKEVDIGEFQIIICLMKETFTIYLSRK